MWTRGLLDHGRVREVKGLRRNFPLCDAICSKKFSLLSKYELPVIISELSARFGQKEIGTVAP